ncbi:hypothetical protein [Paenibacillus wynnii]|uniref:Uncharacterized protein n=1 Tax=Paenibacillus wynnii TaxID=268407 RepID=A0A098M5N7_9BACL|nr:hypothetical protein [Paenibacillus wynnii]KGE17341.1 hypothetical protein PWYN_22250 [Paenibacillus wynnii]
MLIFLMYLFTFIGASLLCIAAMIKLILMFPITDHHKLIAAVSSFRMKFPRQLIASNKSCIVAYNENLRKIAIGTFPYSSQKKAIANLYSFDQILGCEIIENALTITKVSKTSLINRRVADHTEVKPATIHTEEITELTLIIYIQALTTQILHISLLPKQFALKPSDSRYPQIYSEALLLYQTLKSIVTFSEFNDDSESQNKLKRYIY